MTKNNKPSVFTAGKWEYDPKRFVGVIESYEHYKRLYMCSFEPSPIYVELENNIREYYKDSEKLDDKTAKELHKELKSWVKDCGFTNKEYNDAKRSVTGEKHD